MKTLLAVLILVLSIFGAAQAGAQRPNALIVPGVSLGGLVIDRTTPEAVVKSWGQPTAVKSLANGSVKMSRSSQLYYQLGDGTLFVLRFDDGVLRAALTTSSAYRDRFGMGVGTHADDLFDQYMKAYGPAGAGGSASVNNLFGTIGRTISWPGSWFFVDGTDFVRAVGIFRAPADANGRIGAGGGEWTNMFSLYH